MIKPMMSQNVLKMQRNTKKWQNSGVKINQGHVHWSRGFVKRQTI